MIAALEHLLIKAKEGGNNSKWIFQSCDQIVFRARRPSPAAFIIKLESLFLLSFFFSQRQTHTQTKKFLGSEWTLQFSERHEVFYREGNVRPRSLQPSRGPANKHAFRALFLPVNYERDIVAITGYIRSLSLSSNHAGTTLRLSLNQHGSERKSYLAMRRHGVCIEQDIWQLRAIAVVVVEASFSRGHEIPQTGKSFSLMKWTLEDCQANAEGRDGGARGKAWPLARK